MRKMILAISRVSPLSRGLASIVFSVIVFMPIYWIVPTFWENVVVTTGSNFSVELFNLLGLGGLGGIGVSVILLKSGIFGENGGSHPVFLLINTIGALLHLLSFAHYFNPFGVTLDTLYSSFGIWAWFHSKAWEKSWELKNLTWKLVGKISVIFLIFLSMVWFVWPSIQSFSRNINFPFHDIGFSGGILILASFIGLLVGWLNPHGKTYAVIYIAGCVVYIINLMLEFNPFTVALEAGLIWFFIFPAQKNN